MQTQYEDRILFLKEFTRELILNSKPLDMPSTPQEEKEEVYVSLPIQTSQVKQRIPIQIPFLRMPERIKTNLQPSAGLGRTIEMQPGVLDSKMTIEIGEPIQLQKNPQKRFQMPQAMTSKSNIPSEYQPQPMPIPAGFDLGKINQLVFDPRVTIIECPGPGKLVSVRVYGKSNVTKITLSSEEITRVIETFSRQAKIPVISGLFKAAVGNTIITAVISDIVGSRFVITKITPAFAIEQINQSYLK